MVEYALLVVLVAIMGISGMEILGLKVHNQFTEVKDAIGQAGICTPGVNC